MKRLTNTVREINLNNGTMLYVAKNLSILQKPSSFNNKYRFKFQFGSAK